MAASSLKNALVPKPTVAPIPNLTSASNVDIPASTCNLSVRVVIPVTLKPPLVVSVFLELSKYCSTAPVSLAII